MRSRHIRIDPFQLAAELDARAEVGLEHLGLYFALLLSCYTPFGDYGGGRREPIRPDNLALLRRFGDIRKVRRLLDELGSAGLLETQPDGSLLPIHYDPGAWVRRAATPIEYLMVARRDGERCQRCGVTGDLSIDHVVPVIAEGPDRLGNLQLLCRPCNSRKGGRIDG